MYSTFPKVSVIVPIYNVEAYIERCVRSLFEQTLAEIEYIFVNDCTPDASMEVLQRIMEEYPERKPWVNCLNLSRNVGLPQARKLGVEVASGEYLIHCDSDDWVDIDMYQVMYDKAIENNLDIVQCGFRVIGSNDNKDFLCEENEDYLFCIFNDPMGGAVWNKLVRRNLYESHNFYFPKRQMLEDMPVVLQLFLKSQRRGIINRALYNYNFNPQSITQSQSAVDRVIRCYDYVANLKEIYRILVQENKVMRYRRELLKMKCLAKTLLFPLTIENPKKYLPIWRSIFPEINWQYPFLRSEPFTLRLVFVLTLLGIYPYLRRLIK